MRITLLVAALGAAAVRQDEPRPVQWSLAIPPASRAAPIVADLRATVAPGWHLYSLTNPAGGAQPTRIEIPGLQPFRRAGAIGRPAPDTLFDRNFGTVSEVYDDSVTFRIPMAPRHPGTAAGSVVVAVTYQTCSARFCLSPRTDTVSATVTPHH